MKTNIEVGDFVKFQFELLPTIFKAEVLYIPCASGDCWHIKTEDGKLIYVQHFMTMELLQ